MTVVQLIPSPLGGLQSASNTPFDSTFDVAIDGISFNMHPTPETPYLREPAQYRKEQFDTGPEAGEHSLAFWWTRSQLSFHGGAGLTYLDTSSDPEPTDRIRFDSSRNVDVWTPGVVTRLPDANLGISVLADEPVLLATAEVSGLSHTLMAAGSVLKSYRQAVFAGTGTVITIDYGATSPILALATDGRKYFVATSTAIYSGLANGAAAGTALYTFAAKDRVTLGWVKQRLMAGINNSLYELGGTGALPAPVYSHPNVDWVWTAFSESPTGILAAGYAGTSSAIFKMSITDIAGVPTLSGASATATMPVGERVHSLHSSVGSVLGIGTSKGVRVGSFDIYYGNLTYGPLSVETVSPVLCLTSRDRFLYAGCTAGIDGDSGLYRVDLGQPTDNEGRFAYATDILPPMETDDPVTAVGVTHFGQVVFGVMGQGLCIEGVGSGTIGEAYLQTARIRFATTEAKLFKLGSVQGDFRYGRIEVQMLTELQLPRYVCRYGPRLEAPSHFGLIGGALEWAALRFTLIADVVLRSYQVQALPAAARQRLIQLPLLCNDFAQNRSDKTVGYKGFAYARLTAVEAMEAAGDEVTLETFMAPDQRARVIIDGCSFRQVTPPHNGSAVGGMLVLLLRTL